MFKLGRRANTLFSRIERRYGILIPSLSGVIIGRNVRMCTHADQPTAAEIIKKCYDMYDNSKSFQGTLKVKQVDSERKVQMIMKICAVSDGKGMVYQSTGDIETVQSIGNSKPNITNCTFAYDGNVMYTVDQLTKTYSEEPHRSDRISGILRGPLNNIQKLAIKMRVTTTKILNTLVYKIAVITKSGEISILIEKDTYKFIRIVFGTGFSDRNEFSLTDQLFNKPIPEGTFKWAPAPEYKKSESQIPFMGAFGPPK